MQQRHLISLTIMLATFGALAQDRPAAIYDFEVPGSTKWLDTKIDVKAGEVLKFTGGGTIRYAAQLQEIGPAGHVGELRIQGDPSSGQGYFGGPDRGRTDDLFHAIKARARLRHRSVFKASRNNLQLRPTGPRYY